MSETPRYVYCEIQRPRGDFPGRIEEGWWILRGNEVQLCTRSGVALAGRMNRRELVDGLSPAELAQRMLRSKALNKSDDFNRRLTNNSYPKLVY